MPSLCPINPISSPGYFRSTSIWKSVFTIPDENLSDQLIRHASRKHVSRTKSIHKSDKTISAVWDVCFGNVYRIGISSLRCDCILLDVPRWTAYSRCTIADEFLRLVPHGFLPTYLVKIWRVTKPHNVFFILVITVLLCNSIVRPRLSR